MMAIIKRQTITNLDKDVEKWESSQIADKKIKWYSHSGGQLGSFLKVIHKLIIQPSNSSPKYISKGNKYIRTKTGTQIFINIICNSQNMKTTQESINRWKDKQNIWCIYATDEYAAIKRNKILTHATAEMNLKNLILCKRGQTQKGTYSIIPFMWNVQDREIYRDQK